MLKYPTSYEEQIALIRSRGCVVDNEDFCRSVLEKVNYYRLSAYFIPFKAEDGNYKLGTDFNTIYKLYEFDRKLRSLIFTALEEVEVYLKSQIAYYHAHEYGADGYLTATPFISKHDHQKFLNKINELIRSNSNVPFVKHHLNKYAGIFPIWVIMELFTFGMVSYFYADMPAKDKKFISRRLYKTHPKNVESWLYCCTVLRNICAHYGRLYYRVFTSVPANITGINKNAERRLLGALMALRELYPNKEKWNNEIVTSLAALVEDLQNELNLWHIGFAKDWERLIRK
ncbi:MAG: Abi family protein [Defluviitaleaceae bacterium]|nr:Abi family protein [Defluviitaleaceae bacterium]